MSDERFKNQLEALKWLRTKGKISAGKFSQDCRSGEYDLGIATDKTLSKFRVAEYAEKTFGTGRTLTPSYDRSDKMAELELREQELKVEKMELANRKEDANWLQKEYAWAQMAAIIGTLRDSLRHQFHVGSPAVIHAAGGDPARAPEVYEQTEELISRAFNEVVNAGKIEGVFEKGEEE